MFGVSEKKNEGEGSMKEGEGSMKGDVQLRDAVESEIRPWLDVIDNLRAIGLDHDLPIPQIAVMGDQSSGKSSVLEALSGMPFPRGKGLVTRCATQLSLRKGSEWKAESSVLWHAGTKSQPEAAGSIKDPAEVGAHIEKLTEVLVAGSDSDFSQDTICINVESPDVPELTLIDLPGIVRTTTGGQKKEVIDEVNNLINEYLQKERTIVLAVVPANQDVATVDILERAAKVDPEGDRTLAVLTKPDLINPGSEDEARSVLENTRKQIKLGYTMVKLRSQKDLDDGMDLNTARHEEKMYFKNHYVFKDVHPSLLGIHNLTQALIGILVTQIKHHLPAIKDDIGSNLSAVQDELYKLGPPPPETHEAQRAKFGGFTQAFTRLIKQGTDADYTHPYFSSGSPEKKLYTQCRQKFLELQKSIQKEKPYSEDDEYRESVKKAIAESRGRELAGFLSRKVFNTLMGCIIRPWLERATEVLDACFKMVWEVSIDMLNFLAPHHKAMVGALTHESKVLLNKLRDEGIERIDKLFKQEEEPFTLNHYFMDTFNKIRARQLTKLVEDITVSSKRVIVAEDLYANGSTNSQTSVIGLPQLSNGTNVATVLHCNVSLPNAGTSWTDWTMPLQRTSRNQAAIVDTIIMSRDELVQKLQEVIHGCGKIGNASNEDQEVDIMLANIEAYWKVASKRVIDGIPQIIDDAILRPFSNQLQDKLLLLYPDEEKLKLYFRESSETERKRIEVKSKIDRLKKAASILQSHEITFLAG